MPTVLIVDDEPDTVRMLSTALGLFGFETVTAGSGLEALKQIEHRLPDAIVLDLMLPDIDGFEVVRRIRAKPEAAEIPVVALSALPEVNAEDRSRVAGATHYFRKPVGIRNLAQALHSAINNR